MKKYILGFSFCMAICFLTGCSEGYYGPKEAEVQERAIDTLGQKIASNYDMKLLLVGNVADHGSLPYGLLFTSQNQILLPEAQKLAHNVLKDFLQNLKDSPEVNQYIEYSKKEKTNIRYEQDPNSDPNKPKYIAVTKTFVPFGDYEVKPSNLSLRISFWDKDVNRLNPPYIAQITYFDNQFCYYEADPKTQALRLVYKETYNEAVEK